VWMVASRRLSRDLAGALLALVVATDLWTVVRGYWQFMEPASSSFASNAAIDYLKKQPQPFRVLPLQTAPSAAGRDVYLRYDGLMAHGIPVVFGYHGNQLANYDRLAGGGPEYPQMGNPNFWKLANIRYFLTNSPDSMGIPGLKLVAGPARDAAGNELYVHQLPIETSYAWVAPIIVKAGDESVLATVLDPRFDVRRAALFDTSANVDGKTPDALPEPLPIVASVAHYEPGKASIVLDKAAPAGSALIVSENYYPGWSATIDGKPATVGRVDETLIGVPLTAGATRVDLSFSSPNYAAGKKVTFAAVAVAVLALIGGLFFDRRRTTSV
jgi:hypothetical protein